MSFAAGRLTIIEIIYLRTKIVGPISSPVNGCDCIKLKLQTKNDKLYTQLVLKMNALQKQI